MGQNGSRSEDRHPVDRIAETFIERCRRGERPSVSEYIDKYPEHAEEIRELFPALVEMERCAEWAARDASNRDFCGTPERLEDRRLGEYRIVREIGRGGMGVVYEAEQESLGRRVALKVLLESQHLEPRQLERFRREARAAAGLRHPVIVPVYGIGEEDGVHFYVMQLVPGQGLDEVLRELRCLRAGGDGASVNGGGGPADDAAHACARTLVSARIAGEQQTIRSAGSHDSPPGSLCEDVAAAANTPVSSGAAPDAHGPSAAPPAGVRAPGADGSSSSSVASLVDSSATSDGSSLHGGLYFRNIARIGKKVAEAIAYAHGEGLIHRDIKPSNLLLEPGGKVWVSDFGLAKADGADELTNSGEVVGTLRYMAPERFSGWSDPRSDVYALGATLYEALTLRPLFTDTDRRRLMHRIIEEEPPPPCHIDGTVPEDLETVILKAIEKEPARRYASASAFAEDLGRFLAGLPLAARPVSGVERTWRWCRRNPVVASLGAAVFLLVLTVAVVASVAAVRLRAEHDATLENLWKAHASEARAVRWSGRPGRRVRSLAALEKAAAIRPEPELQNDVIAALSLVDIRPLDDLGRGLPEDCALDGELERYAFLSDDGAAASVVVRRLADHRELARFPVPGADYATLRFSPDRRLLAGKCRTKKAGGECALHLWDVERRQELARCPPGGACKAFGFSPDGRWLAVGEGDGTIRLLEVPAFRLWKTVSFGSGLSHLAVDRSGERIAGSLRGPVVRIVDLATGKTTADFVHPSRVERLAWHPRHDLIAVACDDSRVYLWDLGIPEKPCAVFDGHEDQATWVAFHPSGDLLLSWGWDAKALLWNVWTEQLLLTLPTASFPSFSADGRRLRSATQTIAEVVLPRERRTFAAPLVWRTQRHSLALTSVNAPFATSSYYKVQLWDPDSAERLVVPGRAIREVLFTPDGKGLLTCDQDNGVFLRPISRGGGRITLGPARLVLLAKGQDAEITPDGSTLACIEPGRIHVVSLAAPDGATRSVSLPSPSGHNQVSISPDGRWLATAGWQVQSVRTYDVQAAKSVASLPGLSARPLFSPDGRWLVTAPYKDGFYRTWRVPSWTPGPVIAHEDVHPRYAFSLDGRFLACVVSRGSIRLVRVDTWEAVATLPAMVTGTVTVLAFSDDGARLGIVGSDGHRSTVWDLRKVRERLASLRLDWDLPAFPPETARDQRTPAAPTLASAATTRVYNSHFEGVSGATWGELDGLVPDGWRGLAKSPAAIELRAVPLSAGALAPGTPSANALLLRVKSFGSRPEAHFVDNTDSRVPLVPGRHYRLRVWARSANADGADQTFEVGLALHRGPAAAFGRSLDRDPGSLRLRSGADESRPPVATRAWRRFVGPTFEDPEAFAGRLIFRVVDDGGENAILLALPEVEELLHPTDLRCAVAGTTVNLRWENHALHESLRILRDGEEIATLEPDATTFVDREARSGKHVYSVEALVLYEPGGEECVVEVAP